MKDKLIWQIEMLDIMKIILVITFFWGSINRKFEREVRLLSKNMDTFRSLKNDVSHRDKSE